MTTPTRPMTRQANPHNPQKHSHHLWVLRAQPAIVTVRSVVAVWTATQYRSAAHDCPVVTRCGPRGSGGRFHPAKLGAICFSGVTFVAAYLRIKGWDSMYPAGKRLSYAKLYPSVLYDADITALPEIARLILFSCWASAASTQGRISIGTADGQQSYSKLLRSIHVSVSTRTASYVKLLINKGFLILESSGSYVVSDLSINSERTTTTSASPSLAEGSGTALPTPTLGGQRRIIDTPDSGSVDNATVSTEATPNLDSVIHTAERCSEDSERTRPAVDRSDQDLTQRTPQGQDYRKPDIAPPPRDPNALAGNGCNSETGRPQKTGGSDGVARKKRKAPSDKPRETWLTPVEKAWEEWNGAGSFAGLIGEAMGRLAPLYHAHGAEKLAAHVGQYLSETEREPHYRSLTKFAANFAAYTPKPLVNEWGVMTEYGERVTR